MDRDSEIAWLAGLYEGEGSCGVYGPYPPGTTTHLRMSIASTDRDTLDRALRIAGCGSVVAASKEGAKGRQRRLWKWHVQNKVDVFAVCELIYPYLLERRRKQMEPVLEFCRDRIENPRKPGPKPGSGGRPKTGPEGA